jgi:hypothetical protein
VISSHPLKAFGLLLSCALAGCLGPADEETPLSERFGPANLDLTTVPTLEESQLPNVDRTLFSKHLVKLRGYADGEAVWYWNIDGANATFVAPVYLLVDAEGQRLGKPIVDSVPGDAGYTPWWRATTVRVTDKYQGEAIWSRAGIDAAVKAGLVLPPQPTTRIVNCPMVWGDELEQIPDPDAFEITEIWYRGRLAHWITLPGDFDLELTARKMPIFPVYVLQRINEAAPIYEFFTKIDVNGDNQLNDSNNIFSAGLGGARYSPLWEAHLVRVSADYPSIDTSTIGAVPLRAESDLFNAGEPIAPYVLTPTQPLGLLVNCPIVPKETQ